MAISKARREVRTRSGEKNVGRGKLGEAPEGKKLSRWEFPVHFLTSRPESCAKSHLAAGLFCHFLRTREDAH
jgi:hypothetical protein